MAQQLTVTAAARVLGVSRRTVERRVSAGEYASVLVGRRRLVTVPDDDIRPPDGDSGPTAPDMAATVAERNALRQERDNLRSECDVLRQRVGELTEERDYLRRAHATALGTQRLLAERTARPGLWQRLRQWAGGGAAQPEAEIV